jgi:hypothetical protein
MDQTPSIQLSDRCHHQLRALDAMSCTYPDWRADFKQAEEYHFHCPWEFSRHLRVMKRKQNLLDGDRSHNELKRLDSVTFTYPGWHEDFKEVERHHIQTDPLFGKKLSLMTRKQKLHHGDRSHYHLRAIDAVKTTLTYPGWLEEFKRAEQQHIKNPSQSLSDYKELHTMQEKQKIHDGDRSNTQLRALEAMTFNYPGWCEDFREAKISHHTYSASFDSQLSAMKKKQTIHHGDRSHSQLRALDAATFTYTDWREDFKEAEKYHIHNPSLFDNRLSTMKNKQKLHEGDRSHPQLKALDAVNFTYPGWRKDFKEAEKYHILLPTWFERQLLDMQENQTRHLAPPTPTATNSVVQPTNRADPPSTQAAASRKRTVVDLTGEAPATVLVTPKHSRVDTMSKKCVLCLKDEKSHAFVPCGHLCVCAGCAAGNNATHTSRCCAICGTAATQLVKIFY